MTPASLPVTTACTGSATAGSILDLKYNFNLGASDNGNVAGITNDRDSTRSQTFTYDQVNRLVTGGTTSSCGANCWGQTFGYDQWANLLTAAATGSAPALSLTVNTSNRITTAGFNFDAAGNETSDVTSAYAFNAESEIKTGGGVNYTYDGDGNRVQKSNGKIYWYGAGSEILDESDASGNITDEYVFFGGKRIARRNVSSGNVYYYAEDMLGSSRVIVQAGQTSACYDADFYPFGGEKVYVNTCAQNYKWTGKERDAETGNDNFDARYYSSVYGRFLSADWSAVPAPVPYANLTNPQTLNLYAMVGDNPETFADLDGHFRLSLNDWWAQMTNEEDNPPQAAAAEQQNSTSNNAQKSSSPSGQATLELGGTKVNITFLVGKTANGGNGVVIDAYPQGCDNCRWTQTVTRTGDPQLPTQTDREAKSGAQPLYPTGYPANNFYDAPSTHKGGSGTFTAVTTLGVVEKDKTFKPTGSMTWGYSVDKKGNVAPISPRVSTPAEQARSIAVLKRDSPAWTIGP